MARIGSAFLIALAVSTSALADPEITMEADREKVGTEDTFRVEVVLTNAPPGSVLTLPKSEDFEILGQGQSSQMSYSMGSSGAGVVTQVQRHTLTVRANHTGKVTIPPAVLKTPTGTLSTRPVTVEVVSGRLAPDRPQRRVGPNPFGFPPGFPGVPGMDDDADPFEDPHAEELDIPHSDSDLFLRMSVDKSEVYVGEQVMLSIHLYSRVDLSSVDSVIMPKLDGFLSQDFKTPSQLNSEQRVINGVPYREYLLRQKAVFPLKAGSVTVEAAEADITTGLIFASRRVHRKANDLKLVVRKLPPGPETTIVGKWRLSREISQTDVGLGEPIQVKLQLEGRGNLQMVQLPPLGAPPSFRVFDPETSDKPSSSRTQVGGTRVIEYTLVPQQTGTFTLPALSLPYFDPETRQYDEMKVDALTVNVKTGVGGATATAIPSAPSLGDPSPKNALAPGGLKSLRHTAQFSAPPSVLSAQPWFLPVSLAPVVLTLLLAAVVLVRRGLGPESTDSIKRREARAARKRLAEAEKLLSAGSTGDFYAEVERALMGFMSARLGLPVSGLARDGLVAKLTEAGVPEAERGRIVGVLETCDLGRYAPGMGEASARRKVLEDAVAAMEGWS